MKHLLVAAVTTLFFLNANASELNCNLDVATTAQMAEAMQAESLKVKNIIVDSTETQTLVKLALSEPIYAGFSSLTYDLEGVEAEAVASVRSDDQSLTMALVLGEEQTLIHIFDVSENIKAVGVYSCQ